MTTSYFVSLLKLINLDFIKFFDNQHIGGYDEVRTLEKEKKLQDLLK